VAWVVDGVNERARERVSEQMVPFNQIQRAYGYEKEAHVKARTF